MEDGKTQDPRKEDEAVCGPLFCVLSLLPVFIFLSCFLCLEVLSLRSIAADAGEVLEVGFEGGHRGLVAGEALFLDFLESL